MTINVPRREFFRLAAVGGLLLPERLLEAQSADVEARTRFGVVRGARAGGVNVFKGVPYGADTGGANRFMPPKDPAPWSGIKETVDYGPALSLIHL